MFLTQTKLQNLQAMTDRIVRTVLALLLLSFLLILAVGCNRKSKALEATIAELEQTNTNKDAELMALYTDLENIEMELNTVSETYNDGSMMVPLAQESDWAPANRILDEVRYLNSLIQNKTDRIEEIEAQLASSKSQLSGSNRAKKKLKKEIEGLEAELAKVQGQVETAQKDLHLKSEQMASMRNTLENRLNEIALLENMITDKDMENMVLVHELDQRYTGYYITGKYKDLKTAGIVEKEGGVAGVGAVKKLKEDFDKESFESIDIRNTPSIPVQAAKVEIVTSHPEGSYALVEEEGTITALEITDPEDFWKAGPVLVMVTK